MAVWALIHEGEIINVIEWDGVTPYTPPAGTEMIERKALPPHAWLGSKRDARGAFGAFDSKFYEKRDPERAARL